MILPGTADLIAALPAFIGYVPSQTLFSLLVGTDDRVIAIAQIPADANDDELRNWQAPSTQFEDATRIILIAVASDPRACLVRAASCPPFPAESLIGLPSFANGSLWFDLVSRETGHVPDFRESSATARRALAGWEIFASEGDMYRAFEAAAPALQPTRVRSASSVLGRLRTGIKYGQAKLDARSVGGILVHCKESRDSALALIDANPEVAYAWFSASARRLRDQSRLEALVACALAALACGEKSLADTAIRTALHEVECLGVVPIFGSSLLHRVSDLVAAPDYPTSIREFLDFGRSDGDWAVPDGRTA